MVAEILSLGAWQIAPPEIYLEVISISYLGYDAGQISS